MASMQQIQQVASEKATEFMAVASEKATEFMAVASEKATVVLASANKLYREAYDEFSERSPVPVPVLAQHIRTYVPAQVTDTLKIDRTDDESLVFASVLAVLVTVLVALFVLCIGCCCCCRRRKAPKAVKGKKAEAKKAEAKTPNKGKPKKE